MISAIITAYKEQTTIQRAIESIAKQKVAEEIIIIAPDAETLEKAKSLKKKFKELRVIKDKRKGKPAALNLAVSSSKGDILVLTDGDVYIGDNSLKILVRGMEDKKIGAISGRPVPLNSRKSMMGFWAFLLTDVADKRRKRAFKLKRRFYCSGYFFAIRKELFKSLQEEILSEDGFLSHNVYEKGFKIGYEGESKVFVVYPLNFRDWIIQKKRSAGGYNQIKKLVGIEIRSFKKESFGALDLFRNISNLRELVWLLLLFGSRVYLWILIYIDINLKKKGHKEIWKRVESTK